MMQMRKKRAVLEMGHDAFLDIVANLVGILIILVVVLGSQSTAVIEEVREQLQEDLVTESSYASDEQLTQLSQQAMRAASAQADSNRFEGLIKDFDQQLKIKRQQRAIIMDLLSEAEAAWEDKKQELDRQATDQAQELRVQSRPGRA